MNKKNIKVKKGKGDISITIENNLNANNKQINHQIIKRRRRKKKIENNEEIKDKTLEQSLQELPPLKDVSYIKPGPVGAFKIWRDVMDSYNTTVPMNQAQQLGLVAPPQQLALPAPPATPQQSVPPSPVPPATPSAVSPAPTIIEKPLTLENFIQVMSMIREQQQQPPSSWGRQLVDDDEPKMPTSPVFSTMSKPNDLEDDMEFTTELENSVAEVYGTDPNDPETKEASKEVQRILNKARVSVATSQAKRLGTIHGNKQLRPEQIRKSDAYIKYKDTEAYKMAYNKAFNEQISKQKEIIQPSRTRGDKKKVQINDLERQRENERMRKEIEELNKQIPDFSDIENFDMATELAKAGLKPIMTNEDDEQAAGMLFKEFRK